MAVGPEGIVDVVVVVVVIGAGVAAGAVGGLIVAIGAIALPRSSPPVSGHQAAAVGRPPGTLGPCCGRPETTGVAAGGCGSGAAGAGAVVPARAAAVGCTT